MIGYQPVYHRAYLGQQAPLPPAPPSVPAPAPAPTPTPGPLSDLLDTLKWAAIGFAAGGVTGYALGRSGVVPGVGKDGIGGGILGGLGGLAASVLPKLIGG